MVAYYYPTVFHTLEMSQGSSRNQDVSLSHILILSGGTGQVYDTELFQAISLSDLQNHYAKDGIIVGNFGLSDTNSCVNAGNPIEDALDFTETIVLSLICNCEMADALGLTQVCTGFGIARRAAGALQGQYPVIYGGGLS